MNILQDRFGRKFEYLRLSITDVCNFKCTYCLPNGYQRNHTDEELNYSEIMNLISAFAELGTWKIRLTGGEPTLRQDLVSLVEGIRAIPGIRKIALSTNGTRLKTLAPELRLAGLNSLNVSLDSLDEKHFADLTGMDRGKEIYDGISDALSLQFDSVKINAVLMKNTFTDELDRFEAWVMKTPVTVRFIELMPTNTTKKYFEEHHLSAEVLKKELLARGWGVTSRKPGDGPAEEWTHPLATGKLGVIAPYGAEFCSTCNRLRVSARGDLRLCLFAEGNQSLRHLLQSPDQREALKARLADLVYGKEKSHYLPEGRYGNNFSFSAIGG